MKKKYYIHILFFLIFLTVSSCKSQSLITEKEIANKSISYEIVKDSVLCTPPFREKGWYIHYELPFFKTKTDIKKTQPYSFFNKDSLKSELRLTMKTIEKECGEDFIPGGRLNYEIYCNKKNIVSMIITHENLNGRNYPLHFFNYAINDNSLNILTEDSYDIKIIDERSNISFLLMINNDIEKIINKTIAENDFDDFEREITKLEKESVKERLFEKVYNVYNIPKSVIIIDNVDYKEDGVLFCEITAPSFLEERYLSGTMSIFYTFKELAPFLAKKIKKKIGI